MLGLFVFGMTCRGLSCALAAVWAASLLLPPYFFRTSAGWSLHSPPQGLGVAIIISLMCVEGSCDVYQLLKSKSVHRVIKGSLGGERGGGPMPGCVLQHCLARFLITHTSSTTLKMLAQSKSMEGHGISHPPKLMDAAVRLRHASIARYAVLKDQAIVYWQQNKPRTLLQWTVSRIEVDWMCW